jgi:integrase
MARTAKLYQRLQEEGNPWVALPVSKQFTARPRENAYAFGIRYTLGGKRRMDTADTVDEALVRLRQVNVALYSVRNGVAAVVDERQPKTPMADAIAEYKSNLAARGCDVKTIRSYSAAVDQFAEICRTPNVEDVVKQDILDYMGWLRKQPVPMRKRSDGSCSNNPERSYANKVGNVAIFLKAYGVSGLLKKSEYPQYTEKLVSAHSDDELAFLYAHADSDQRFLLDYFLGSGVRDGEAAHAEYTDLRGNVLEIKHKPHLNWHPKKHECRKIPIPQSLADSIRARQKSADSPLIFPNSEGKPNEHLLRVLQDDIAKKAGAKFATELHKLRKSRATRWAAGGIRVDVIQKLLGHKNLSTTQRYLADVDLSSDEMRKLVEAAAYVPKAALKVVA